MNQIWGPSRLFRVITNAVSSVSRKWQPCPFWANLFLSWEWLPADWYTLCTSAHWLSCIISSAHWLPSIISPAHWMACTCRYSLWTSHCVLQAALLSAVYLVLQAELPWTSTPNFLQASLIYFTKLNQKFQLAALKDRMWAGPSLMALATCPILDPSMFSDWIVCLDSSMSHN